MTGPRARHSPARRLLEFAPSVGWFSLMVLPVLFQYETFHPIGRRLQLLVVLVIGLMFLVADWIAAWMNKLDAARADGNHGRTGQILIGLLFLAPAAVHLCMMPRIPLLAALMDNDLGTHSLLQLRDDSAKFLDVPSIVKYLFNWSLFIFGPIFIAVSYSTGRRLQAVAGIAFGCVYALASLAKFPAVLFLLSCWFAASMMPTRCQEAIGRGLVVTALVGSLLVGVWAVVNGGVGVSGGVRVEPTPIAAMKRDDPRRAFSYGDHMRLNSIDKESPASSQWLTSVVEYVFYRVWLTPADVSNRWYQYFTYVAPEPVGLHFLLPWERTESMIAPSRLVGVWAYQSRFPDKYTTTINANASFDADAFAHGGALAVAIATTLLLAIRIGVVSLLTGHPIVLAGYGTLLCFLAVLPSSASLQAILGANGLMTVPVLVFALYVCRRYRANGPMR